MTTLKEHLLATGQELSDADARREADRLTRLMRERDAAARLRHETAVLTKAYAALIARLVRNGLTEAEAATWLGNAERALGATRLAEQAERRLRAETDARATAGANAGANGVGTEAQPGRVETKASPLSLEPQGATGRFTGLASPFGGHPDLAGDVVDPGAYTQTIADARARGKPTLWPVLYQHDPTKPIGGITAAAQRDSGLYVEGQIDLNTIMGNEAYSLMRNGFLTGLSIGYRTIKDRYLGGVRHLLVIDLLEISVVTFPAADQAQVSSVGSVGSVSASSR